MSQDVAASVPLRVAFVSGSLPLGGSTTFVCNLGGELVRRGIPVRVLSMEKASPLASDFQRLNIPVQSLDERHFIYEDRLAMVLNELGLFKPAIVLANLSASSFEVLRYLPAGVFRVGVGQSDDPLVYEMMRQYAPHMDLLAVVSKTMKAKAEAMPEFGRVPVHYLPYGVPLPESLDDTGRRKGPLRILYLGRLWQAQKRVRLLPVILDRLKSSGIPFHWTIAGEGPEQVFLQQSMKPAPPEQTVSFTGSIPYRDVPQILREHDVFLLTSEFEGLPLSLLEAMGAGLVPVVSDLKSGVSEVVDTTNGILVPVNDVEGYARAIIHLHQHRDELAAKSAAARARVKTEFSVAAMTDRWLAALPKAFPAIGAWPTDWDIKAPLPARHPIYFSQPMRMLRRLAARFRQ
jgi:glycosyltransferase involved in cell wall biosynthesis